MLEQIIQLVKQSGQNTVVDNPEVPDQYNSEVMADATKTITSGFQNVMAGGGFANILDLFRNGAQQGKGGLLKNPMVTMMIGYFMNKLVGKYNMSSGQASQVANNLIPDVLNNLVSKTTNNDPENDAFDFNDLIGSLTGGKVSTSESSNNGFNFQDLLDRFTGNQGQVDDDNDGGNGLSDIIRQVTSGARENTGGGGIVDMIRGLFSR